MMSFKVPCDLNTITLGINYQVTVMLSFQVPYDLKAIMPGPT